MYSAGLKILFVCTINRMRSATAEVIFREDERFVVKSAGTDPKAAVVISGELLDWADSIVVMEKHHRNHIRKLFSEIYHKKKIVCLYIRDEYDFMDPELILLLRERLDNRYNRGLL